MAISIDWPTKVINVPKADTTLVDVGPPEIRALDVNQFRKDLNALQASENGMPELTTHIHTAPVVLGGVTFARQVEIINGYTVTFEDGSYAVNLTEANNNISDVTNLNTVSIRSANSAGLVEGSTLSLTSLVEGTYTVQDSFKISNAALAALASGVGTSQEKFRDLQDLRDRITVNFDANGNRTSITLDLT